jgi:SNF2 family DNA or RNA helicase
LELDMQLLGRLRRQGSTAKRIIVHRLVARNTVDELVIEALKDKEHTQAALFEGLKQLAKRRSR